MKKRVRTALWALACLFPLAGCMPPMAAVFINPQYPSGKVRAVALAGFDDCPGLSGSGEVAADIFEKYLGLAGYSYLDQRQVKAMMQREGIQAGDGDPATLRRLGGLLGVDALLFGRVSDYSDARDRTTMVDMPLEQSEPVFGNLSVISRRDGVEVRTDQPVISGYSYTQTDVPVQQTETVPAHVGLSLRLVDCRSGQVLWSASGGGTGDHLNDAAEDASQSLMKAVAGELQKRGKP